MSSESLLDCSLCRLDIPTLFKIREWERYRFFIDYEHLQALLLMTAEEILMVVIHMLHTMTPRQLWDDNYCGIVGKLLIRFENL